ncbi:MAG: hypothetical protein ACFB14_14010 [Leptolyngbyaceae cyanobacterium]
MPRRKRLFSTRTRKSSSSVLVGYIVLFFLAIALIQMLLPFIILAGIGWGIYKAWQYWSQQQQTVAISAEKKEDKLTSAFYALIQEHQGRISVFDFAMTAKVTAPEARNFLDGKAKEFCADFEATESGQVLYVFDSLKNETPSQQAHTIREVEEPKQISSDNSTEGEQVDLSVSFNQAELARRLSLSSSSVGRKKFSPDFSKWSQERDPQGWSWSYSAKKKRFHPVKR